VTELTNSVALVSSSSHVFFIVVSTLVYVPVIVYHTVFIDSFAVENNPVIVFNKFSTAVKGELKISSNSLSAVKSFMFADFSPIKKSQLYTTFHINIIDSIEPNVPYAEKKVNIVNDIKLMTHIRIGIMTLSTKPGDEGSLSCIAKADNKVEAATYKNITTI